MQLSFPCLQFRYQQTALYCTNVQISFYSPHIHEWYSQLGCYGPFPFVFPSESADTGVVPLYPWVPCLRNAAVGEQSEENTGLKRKKRDGSIENQLSTTYVRRSWAN